MALLLNKEDLELHNIHEFILVNQPSLIIHWITAQCTD